MYAYLPTYLLPIRNRLYSRRLIYYRARIDAAKNFKVKEYNNFCSRMTFLFRLTLPTGKLSTLQKKFHREISTRFLPPPHPHTRVRDLPTSFYSI